MNKLFFLSIAVFITTAIFGQTLVGDWSGAIEIQGTELPIIFHVSQEAGIYSASFDSPAQQAFGLAVSEVKAENDSVTFVMQVIGGKYSGKLNSEKLKITGNLYQNGLVMPLVLNKTLGVASSPNLNRPQTPKPPFPYKSEEVIYQSADKSIQFGATFTVPLPDPNVDYFRAPIYPTALLISGSGKQDRDETISGHKPFAVLADYLTRNGIAVLRVDDRGMGKTTGNFGTSTTADFAKDVEAGIAYLKTRQDVDLDHIGLIGHSEGGLIAPMVASQRKDIGFIVLLAGPGIPVLTMMEQQSADVLASSGIPAPDIEQYRPLYKNIVTTIINAPDSSSAVVNATAVFKKWQLGKSARAIKNTTGVSSEKDIEKFVGAFMKDLNSPWFNYFMKQDPGEHLVKTNCPVLAINGEKDIQVSAKQNLAGIQAALEKAGNKNFKTREMPGLNHLFQHCTTCTVQEYGELEESFDPATMKLIAEWIKNESTL